MDQVMAHETDPITDRLGPAPPNNPAKPGQPGVNIAKHWVANTWGRAMTSNVNTISIHETSGYPSYQSSLNMVNAYLCLSDSTDWVEAKVGPPAVPAHWRTLSGARGVGPQYYIDGNGTVFAMIGEHDLGASPRVTWHTETINATSIGIENGDMGNHEAGKPDLRPARNASGPYWFRLSTTPANDDLTGFIVFALLHPHNAPDLNLIWFATQATGTPIPNYPGSGDTDRMTRYPRWHNQIFTERDYRGLALLTRLLCEQYSVPRNFPILPYSKIDTDGATSAVFRKIILADERRDLLATKIGLNIADIQSNDVTNFQHKYTKTMWARFFGVYPAHQDAHGHTVGLAAELPSYKGFIGHAIIGDHPCPGPLFDWHRFSREVWDWWWYPFDINHAVVRLFADRRSYMNARGTTPLQEYFYDAEGTDAEYNALIVRALDTTRGVNNFHLDASTPMYAMANGVMVAARLNNPPDPVVPTKVPFTLVRHEVFHRGVNGRINYDLAPTTVWTLTTYLECDDLTYTQLSNNNPDWLNRMLIRLTECKLAVDYKAAHNTTSANDKLFKKAWDYAPTSTGPRNTTGQDIENDAAEYRRIVDLLQGNDYALFPLEASTTQTAVRVILGDFLGKCGTLSDATSGTQVQIFSLDPLPVLNATQSALVWKDDLWWKKASEATRLDGGPQNSLPDNGFVWQYDVVDFLTWINGVTWTSEWPKYEVTVGGNPAPVPARPLTRIISD